jgi:hypothetical protein
VVQPRSGDCLTFPVANGLRPGILGLLVLYSSSCALVPKFARKKRGRIGRGKENNVNLPEWPTAVRLDLSADGKSASRGVKRPLRRKTMAHNDVLLQGGRVDDTWPQSSLVKWDRGGGRQGAI